MIETPSLRTRVTLLTFGSIVVLVLGIETAVYLAIADRLDDGLQQVLTTRTALVAELAQDAPDLTTLEQELTAVGVPAVLRGGDDAQVHTAPATTGAERVRPGDDLATTTVRLADGSSVEVAVPRGSVDRTLRRVLLAEVAGSGAALAIAVLLVLRASSVVTRPLDRIVDTAGEIAAGDRGRRLEPSDPTTELGRMAAAFDTTIDALERALAEAEEAEARSRRFLADAAHQLRTPLTGLRASAEHLLADPDGPDRHRMVVNVSREATRMSRLVDRLLRIARIDRGEAPAWRATDVVALAQAEVDRQRPLAPQLTFSLTSDDDVPVVRCEPAAVRDALANLLDNARRFASSQVAVTISAELGSVDLAVHDDGPGVPPDRTEEVFHRFTTTTADGSGLGLPIARGIAEAHGGALRLVDGVFVLTLPVAPLEG